MERVRQVNDLTMGWCVNCHREANANGIEGAALVMINHGVTTGALFICVGIIYERLHTRDLSAAAGMGNMYERPARAASSEAPGTRSSVTAPSTSPRPPSASPSATSVSGQRSRTSKTNRAAAFQAIRAQAWMIKG